VKTKKFLLMMSTLLLLGVVFRESGEAQFAVRQSVFGNGSAAAAGVNQKMAGMLGEPLVGRSGNSAFISTGGFWYHSGGLMTGVHGTPEGAPTVYRLEQNYPNPFNPVTTIRYELSRASYASLKVFNMLGQEVRTLVDGQQPAGMYEVGLDARGLASGVYVYRLSAGEYSATRKLVLLK
jgi:hypothetical protein